LGTWKDVFSQVGATEETTPREKAIAYKHKLKFQMLNNFPKTTLAVRLRDTLRQRIKAIVISRTKGECRYLDKWIL
jgi:hypothetical protein